LRGSFRVEISNEADNQQIAQGNRLKCLDGCYAVLRENLNKIYTKLGDFLEDSGGYKV
jgi:hypothetical protein